MGWRQEKDELIKRIKVLLAETVTEGLNHYIDAKLTEAKARLDELIRKGPPFCDVREKLKDSIATAELEWLKGGAPDFLGNTLRLMEQHRAELKMHLADHGCA